MTLRLIAVAAAAAGLLSGCVAQTFAICQDRKTSEETKRLVPEGTPNPNEGGPAVCLSSEKFLYFKHTGPRAPKPSSYSAGGCRKGKPCGRSCIARWKTCHK